MKKKQICLCWGISTSWVQYVSKPHMWGRAIHWAHHLPSRCCVGGAEWRFVCVCLIEFYQNLWSFFGFIEFFLPVSPIFSIFRFFSALFGGSRTRTCKDISFWSGPLLDPLPTVGLYGLANTGRSYRVNGGQWMGAGPIFSSNFEEKNDFDGKKTISFDRDSPGKIWPFYGIFAFWLFSIPFKCLNTLYCHPCGGHISK